MGDDVRNVGWLAVVVVIEIPRDEGKDRGRFDRVGFRRRVTDSHLCRGFERAGLPAFRLGLERLEGGFALLLFALAGVAKLVEFRLEGLQLLAGITRSLALLVQCGFECGEIVAAVAGAVVVIGAGVPVVVPLAVVGAGSPAALAVCREELAVGEVIEQHPAVSWMAPASRRVKRKAAPDLVWRSGPLGSLRMGRKGPRDIHLYYVQFSIMR